MVGSGLNHTPHACVELAIASSFEVKAVVRGTTSIKRSGMHKLATTPSAALFPIFSQC